MKGERRKEWQLTFATVVVLREIIRRVERKIFNQPTVSQRSVCDKGNVEFTGCVDEAVALVDGLKGRIFSLDGINPRDCRCEYSPVE